MAATSARHGVLGSDYLMDFTIKDRGLGGAPAAPVLYPLNISDGPNDTWEQLAIAPNYAAMAYSKSGCGNPPLRELVAEQHGFRAENIILLNGGTSICNHHVINALLHRGGNALVEFPVYDPLEGACRVSHADNAADIGTNAAYQIPRAAPSFQICEDEFKSALERVRPRLVVVSNPHNPTGIALHNLPALVKIVDAWNESKTVDEPRTYMLVDEVYREAHVGEPIASAAHLSTCVVTTCSLTKVFGLSGVRMGVVVARCPDAALEILKYNTIASCANPGFLEDIWMQIYRQKSALLARTHDRQLRMSAAVFAELDRARVSYYKPDGGTVVVVKLPDSNSDDKQFVAALRERHSVLVTAGSFFRMRGHVRLAYMNLPEATVREAITLFADFYAEWSNKVGRAPTALHGAWDIGIKLCARDQVSELPSYS